jgi:hypothetical protein
MLDYPEICRALQPFRIWFHNFLFSFSSLTSHLFQFRFDLGQPGLDLTPFSAGEQPFQGRQLRLQGLLLTVQLGNLRLVGLLLFPPALGFLPLALLLLALVLGLLPLALLILRLVQPCYGVFGVIIRAV